MIILRTTIPIDVPSPNDIPVAYSQSAVILSTGCGAAAVTTTNHLLCNTKHQQHNNTCHHKKKKGRWGSTSSIKTPHDPYTSFSSGGPLASSPVPSECRACSVADRPDILQIGAGIVSFCRSAAGRRVSDFRGLKIGTSAAHGSLVYVRSFETTAVEKERAGEYSSSNKNFFV